MTTGAAVKAPPTKPKKDRERNRKDKLPQVTERLKVVVRRLPPNLPEDVFWQSVDNWVSEETVVWKTFFPGKFRKRLNKENIPSRAYIAFKSEEQLALFSQDYDGHMFRDKAGNESQAVVEFAPYQKVPTEKKKLDARNATIEKDEDYISFLESLKAVSNTEPVSLESLLAAAQPQPPPKTTPLLEALKAEKSAHKDKEAILRNHAHYKDQINAANSRKDDSKKKASAGQRQAEPASNSKKDHKKPTAVTPATSAQKPLPVTTAGKDGNNAAPSKMAPKSPKATRASRQSQVKVAAGNSKQVVTSEGSAPPSSEVTGIPPTQSGPAAAAATVPPRRTRPVIGLASRQFEAALTGAGVGAAGERKSRREREKEREKEKEKEKDKEVGTANGGTSVLNGGTPVVKFTPPSPRRDRSQRVKESGATPGGQEAVRSSIKVPSILQRNELQPPSAVQKEVLHIHGGDNNNNSGPPVATLDVAGSHVGGGGGGRGARRGRGRGRGSAAPRGS